MFQTDDDNVTTEEERNQQDQHTQEQMYHHVPNYAHHPASYYEPYMQRHQAPYSAAYIQEHDSMMGQYGMMGHPTGAQFFRNDHMNHNMAMPYPGVPSGYHTQPPGVTPPTTPYASPTPPTTPTAPTAPIAPTDATMVPLEVSYIENILRFNRGKFARFYMTFENNPEWPARVFSGIIEEAGRDHIIVRSVDEGPNYLLLMVSLDYVEFDEDISYVPQPGIPTQQR